MQIKFRNPVLTNLPQKALILGLAAASLAVSAGSAKAAITTKGCSFYGSSDTSPFCSKVNWTASPTDLGGWVLGDKLFRLINPDDPGNPGALPGLSNLAGHVDFSWNDGGTGGNTYGDDNWTANIIFDSAIADTTGYWDYTLEVLDPNWQFKSVTLDSNAGIPGITLDTTVTKTIKEFPTFIQESKDGSTAGPTSISGSFVTVRDSFSTASPGSLTSFTNTFQQATGTPGPLPLLGAGAAFGFSRQLRKRIRKYTLA